MTEIGNAANGAYTEHAHKEAPRSETLWSRYRGLFFSAIGAMFFSSAFLVIKELEHYHPITLSLWKQLSLLIPTIPLFFVVMWRDVRKHGRVMFWSSVFPMDNRQKKILFGFLLFRSILGVTGQLLQVWSLQYLSVGDSSIFAFSNPIVVVLLAAIFLGEKCSVVSTLVVVMTILGVGVMVRPPILTGQANFDMNNLFGIILGTGGMFCFASVIIILRKVRTVHWAFNLLVFGVIGILECGITAGILGVFELPTTTLDICLSVVALPLTVGTSQLCNVLAYKFEKAGPASLIATIGVPFSFVLQYIFYGTAPDAFSTIGGGIVILGVFVITAKKYIEELSQEDPIRKRFRFILF